jgi:hypothetical protein
VVGASPLVIALLMNDLSHSVLASKLIEGELASTLRRDISEQERADRVTAQETVEQYLNLLRAPNEVAAP